MPIAFRSIAGNSLVDNTAGDKTLTINKPAGTVDGDVMLAVVTQASYTAPPLVAAPAGWASLGAFTNTNGESEVFYRTAASEGASYNFTVAGGDPCVAVGAIASYSGVELSPSPIDAVGGQHSASSANATAPSAAPSAVGAMLVCCFCAEGGANTTTVTSTPPSGMTERGDIARLGDSTGEYSAALDVQASVNDVLLASADPTGAKTAVLSAARENNGFSVLLRPVGAPPPPASALGLHMVI